MCQPSVVTTRPKDADGIELVLFFDGHCPLCSAEMRQLFELDRLKRLLLVDLHQVDFDQLYPHIDKVQASKILQAQQKNGSMLYGLDANCKAWELVGRKGWLRILRWPFIRVIADFGYLIFANNRSLISYVATGQRRCSSCELGKVDL